jgi:deoxyribodipyrimidine photolyase
MIPETKFIRDWVDELSDQDKDYILGLPDDNFDLFSSDQKSYPTPTYRFFRED